MAVVDFVFRIELILKEILKDFSALVRIRRFSCRAGQSNKIWDRSQIHSFR